MTPRQEVQELLDGYRLGTILEVFGARLYVESAQRRGTVVAVFEMTVPERRTSDPFLLQTRFTFQHGCSMVEMHRAVFSAIAGRVTHELGEALHHGDTLLFDPHDAPFRTWPWAIEQVPG